MSKIKRNWISTQCNDCGCNNETYYDTNNDHYKCYICVCKEENEAEEEEEDNYPLDATYNEIAIERNK